MFAFLALVALGFVLLGAGIVANDQTLRGTGIISAFCGFVGALALAISMADLSGRRLRSKNARIGAAWTSRGGAPERT
jgi:hypothetical protein